MSCGNPHETDCSEVLDLVYGFLDGELDDADRAKIAQHLDECGPCLRQYGLEKAVKALVHRSCVCEHAPELLRVQIVARIATMQRDRPVGRGDGIFHKAAWKADAPVVTLHRPRACQTGHAARRCIGKPYGFERIKGCMVDTVHILRCQR